VSQAGWAPRPARYGVRVQHNVPVRMSDGTVLRVDVHHPADPATGEPAPGPFPVLLSMTPYGKKAPPPAGQLGGGATPYLIRRGYIEVLADVRGTGASGGVFEMFGDRQLADGVELVRWAAALPRSTGRVGMFGVSYLAINQLFTASGVGPGSPLRAIFPMMAANDFYRDVAAMGGLAHLPVVRGYAASYVFLNVFNSALEAVTRGGHPRPRSGGLAAVRQHGRDQRNYFRTLIADAAAGGDVAYDGPYWAGLRPADVLDKIVANDVAVLLVGGWHDAFQRGAPRNWTGLQNAAAGRRTYAPLLPGQPVSGRFRLVMGPWYHVTRFTGVDIPALQLRWFDHWLQDMDTGLGEADDRPLTLLPVTGGTLHTSSFPPPDARPVTFYPAPNARLLTTPGPSTEARLNYTPRGPIAGRSREQWSFGVGSYLLSRAGRPSRSGAGNRRLERGSALTFTTGPFREPRLLAGPATLTLSATADTTETAWVAHLDLVTPDGRTRPLTEGALLGSHRALDEERTWYTPDGDVLWPYHRSTRESCRPVAPGEPTRYDVELFPTAALITTGDRLRLTLTTSDFPQLSPSRPARRALAGGHYRLHLGGAHGCRLILPLASPAATET